MEERKKICSELMAQGICPICKIKMTQDNGKPMHSKTKSIVCEEQLRELLKVERSTMNMPDGSKKEVDVRYMKKEDAHNLKGFRN